MRDRYINKVKSLRVTSNAISYLDILKKIQPAKSLFLITFFLLLTYSSNPSSIWRTSITVENFFFYLVFCSLIISFSFFVNLKKDSKNINYIKKLIFTYSWSTNKMDALRSLFMNLFIILILGIISYFGGLTFYHSVVFFLYFYNIAYLYTYCVDFRKTNKQGNVFHVKVISLFIYALTLYLAIVWIQNEPLLLTSLTWLFPFYIALFASKGVKAIFLLYRVSFFIITFFLSTTIFPYFFCLILLLIWTSKFYYLFKYNVKYPSFIDIYDNR